MYINSQPIFFADTSNPDFLREWREHDGSLTDKLIAAQGSTDLDVVFQNWSNLNWWEQYVLNLKDARVFLREIIMKNA
ncbi:MAG: chorismate lyase, partial [Gammaproteobacteria bacterium]|nr:chorismate lyase [Gammaproteobacteria bacterium]